MAQLTSTVVSGSLRVTDSTYTSTLQTQILHAPTTSNGTTYGAGTDGQILRTNGTSAYWGNAPTTGVTSITIQTSSPLSGGSATATTGTGSYTIGFTNQNKNLVLAGPSTGSAAAPTFRALVEDDIPTISASKASLGSVSNNADLNGVTGAKGDIIYWSAADTPAHLTNTSSTTKHFLSITNQVPSWVTLSKSDVGLGNVENTKLSTWTGSTNIGTVGTITSGTWNGTAIAAGYIGDLSGTYVKLDGSNNMTGTLSTKRTTTGNFIDLLQNTVSCGCLRLDTLGTTSAEGWADLLLGNTEKSNVANNASGRVYLANSEGTWLEIKAMHNTLAGSTRDYININNWLNATGVTGAVWNDYAEFRKTNKEAKAGQVVVDNDDGSLSITDKRLMPGAQIVSDTFGFSIGETKEAKTPLAVSGRVLVYTYRPREEYHAGMVVCSAPNGTIDIMTREEIQQYPDAIIGIVSEIPEYEEWGTGKVKVDGRIWIKVR